MDYIISQRKHLYIDGEKIIFNRDEIEYTGELSEAVKQKKIEIYRGFFSKQFENTIVLTGAGTSYGIGKTDIKGMTMKKLWEKIVEKCGKEKINEVGKKINYLQQIMICYLNKQRMNVALL